MDYLVDNFDQALSPLRRCNNISSNLINDLWLVLYKLHQQKRFSTPMLGIEMYIAVASLLCIVAMVADLLHSLLNRKIWIQCKYFTLHAVSLTVIAVAVKLPMDLTSPVAGGMDQQAKLGSVAFMCIMMAFLLPCLATMNRKELVVNIIALGVLVITMAVNVCIQINTGLVSYSEDLHIFGYANREIAITYVAMLLMLLMIYICSALMILKAKQDLESKYQAAHKRALKVQQAGQLTVENLKQRLVKYGIMAGTGSPQLMTACSATSSASAVICVSISMLHLINERRYKAYDSDYKWSTFEINIIQYSGIVLGAIALFIRFIAPLTFKPSKEGIWKLMKFYEVESLWTHTSKTYYWKLIPYRRSKFYKLQILGLTLLTESQKAIVITCKAIRMIPVLISICVCYCYVFVFSSRSPLVDAEKYRDFRLYDLQPQDHMELGGFRIVTVNFIIKSVERSIRIAEKQQPSKLMRLLENYRHFEGVKKFDRLLVQSLPGLDYPNCWSLPVVTLANIALCVQRPINGTLKDFRNEVKEGLVYVKLVEESLNNKDELVSVQKAAERLWLELEVYHKWLGHELTDIACEGSVREILLFFRNTAKDIVTEVGCAKSGGSNDDSICRCICANSMYRITETIMDSYKDNNIEVRASVLFDELSSMISDIVAACLTNLPQVITLKCHTSAIEKREESVHAAATLLGKTSKIINTLKDRVPASLINNPGELPYIDKWRGRLTASAS